MYVRNGNDIHITIHGAKPAGVLALLVAVVIAIQAWFSRPEAPPQSQAVNHAETKLYINGELVKRPDER
jgi:hypothetical protein